MAPNEKSKNGDDSSHCSEDAQKLTINGQEYTLDSSVSPKTSLLTFIREVALLKGTKGLCYEGGCGVCTVVATAVDHETGALKKFSLRACQTLVYSCSGWSVETVENLGNRYHGYDKIQTTLAGFYGTQCGFCTPGFVMTMHGERESSGKSLTSEQVERALDGNICRCTGYRPILDAFKSLTPDASQDLKERLADIEDINKILCSKSGKPCSGSCGKDSKTCGDAVFAPKAISCTNSGITWHRPDNLGGVLKIMRESKGEDKVRFVVGNTGAGVFKRDGPFNVFIDTSGLNEFYACDETEGAFGANVSLSRAIVAFERMASECSGYAHLKEVADHWRVVANVGVRNTSCWAGNLAMKHRHPDFPSDIFITLAAVDAQVTLANTDTKNLVIVSVEEFMKVDLKDSVIISMKIPKLTGNVQLRTFKITPRAVNAHAILNAGFRFQLGEGKEYNVVEKPKIVFGGVNGSFVHASKTETFLNGKSLSDPKTISSAMVPLKEDLSVMTQDDLQESKEYRLELAKSLLYKTVLGIVGDHAGDKVRSGANDLKRPVSSGVQMFDANKDSWPVGKAIPKLESLLQVSGEAEYVNDIKSTPDELFGVFLQSKHAKATIESISAEKCKTVEGFVEFVTAADIPGVNSFTYYATGGICDPVFADKCVKYHGQAIGLVVAKTAGAAFRARSMITVNYTNIEKPVTNIRDAIKLGRTVKKTKPEMEPIKVGDVESGFKESDVIVEGSMEQGSQFHFTMEPHSALVAPIEDGYDVSVTSQWPTEAQVTVARLLNIDSHCVNVSVRRIGGGFGGKISRAHIVSCAAAVAAHKTHKPVRVTLDLATHMSLVGWREPYFAKYKIGSTNEGILKSVSVDFYSDTGYIDAENSVVMASESIPNAYYFPNLHFRPYAVITDTPANTWCRTPGHVEALGLMEHMVDHIAHTLKMDPLVLRKKNLSNDTDKPHMTVPIYGPNLLKDMIPMFETKVQLAERQKEIQVFNKNNRWKKRGLATMPMYYPFSYPGFFRFNTMISIYELDGTVAIVHGGIEMGQGINTKVAQIAAHTLGIPMHMIVVKPTETFVTANSSVTGGSFGTDLNPYAIKVCCEALRKRMDPVAAKIVAKRENGNQNVDWLELVQGCTAEQVDLSERYQVLPKEFPKGYNIFGVAATEVEIDVLTGQHLVLRTDILEDCGRSMSPYIDIGQVEGSFIMGMGLFTSERVKHNKETGQKLSVGTWDYKPPTAQDIPVDFRVSFVPKGDNAERGVVRSKATGEPAVCMSYSVVMALRQAIMQARKDAGLTDWIDMDTPLTTERIRQHCHVVSSRFTL